MASNPIQLLKLYRNVFKGQREFDRTGATPEYAYMSLIQLYCLTAGASNDWLHSLAARRHPAPPVAPASGMLGELTTAVIAEYTAQLERDGYFVFPAKLPAAQCDELTAHALAEPGTLSPPDPSKAPSLVYRRGAPESNTYRFSEPQILASPAAQDLIADPSLLAIARAYLKCDPIVDLTAFWWSTAYSRENLSENAQLYHFDMDRTKWLKFFVYLTDVTTETGPHCFIKGSHKSKTQSRELLKRGYVRQPDEDIYRIYGRERAVEITGERGAIVAVDTRGLHKGKPLERDDRLVLQIEFADSLFGGTYTRPAIASPTPSMRRAAKADPWVYSRFDMPEAAR